MVRVGERGLPGGVCPQVLWVSVQAGSRILGAWGKEKAAAVCPGLGSSGLWPCASVHL